MGKWPGLVAVIIALGACRDAPTGVELLERTDRVQTQLRSYSGGELTRLNLFMTQMKPLLEAALAVGDLTVRVGAEERTYRGFVYEMVAVRMNPHDGFPCPLVHRMLVLWPKDYEGLVHQGSVLHYTWKGWDAIFVGGSDFKQPIKLDHHTCQEAGVPETVRPLVTYIGYADPPQVQEGLRGRASIQPAPSRTESCPRNPFENPEIRTDCEMADFDVALETEVAAVTWERQNWDSLDKPTNTGPPTTIRIMAQHLPGFRVRRYCNAEWIHRGACSPFVRTDSVEMRRLHLIP